MIMWVLKAAVTFRFMLGRTDTLLGVVVFHEKQLGFIHCISQGPKANPRCFNVLSKIFGGGLSFELALIRGPFPPPQSINKMKPIQVTIIISTICLY